MNPLARFIAMALFVVLAALFALLAIPMWPGVRTHLADGVSVSPGSSPTHDAASPAMPSRAVLLSQRVALALGAVALALTLALIVSVAGRPARVGESRMPFTA